MTAREEILRQVTLLLGHGPGRIATSSGFLYAPSYLETLGLDPATITALTGIYMPSGHVTDACWTELAEEEVDQTRGAAAR